MALPQKVRIVEVGPRDGLQNEAASFDTQTRIELIRKLMLAGVSYIEAGAFVSPKWVPKMADTALVLAPFDLSSNVDFAVLVPNLRGLDQALEAGVQEIAVFGAASESFSQKNINCSVAESIARFKPVCERAIENGLKVRGYISCVLGCPYEGDIDPNAVAAVTDQLFDQGCYEVSLGDTIGTGTARAASSLIELLSNRHSVEKLAVHFHDTYGQALANIYASLEQGVQVIDSSVAGLGGCPYAPGAAGNVATEDVVYLLNGLGIEHGINMDKLIDASEYILSALDKTPTSRVSAAMLSKRQRAQVA